MAMLDVSESKVGETIAGVAVRHLDELQEIVHEYEVAIGIIATPANAAQDAADLLASAGVPSILNFAPAVVSGATHQTIRKVDLAVELQILSFYQQRRNGGPASTEDTQSLVDFDPAEVADR